MSLERQAMNLTELRGHFRRVQPILEANLAAAHREYMDGKIAAGAYGHVRSRLETALFVLANEVIQSCALLAIDLRSGLTEVVDRDEAQQHIDDWWQCFREAGFTEVHPFFRAPQRPPGLKNVSTISHA
jgi:hypothetical protein